MEEKVEIVKIFFLIDNLIDVDKDCCVLNE